MATITSTTRPPRVKGGKKVIIRKAHNRGPQAVSTYTRRLANGKVILVKSHRRTSAFITQHEKAGKGYGIREKRASGKVDYKRKMRSTKDRIATNKTSRKSNISSK
ncbi:hypothetical protein RZS08_10380 [Arthrospira platensis SPKY1]|nr:hypothetical protein [Arthrospira platensis SPKY1]